jgi:tetratricopeptide (TPR) repeat protein
LILCLLKKYTSESLEKHFVNELHFTPLYYSKIPKNELFHRLEHIVMDKLYKVGSHKTWVRDSVKPDVFFLNYDELIVLLSELIDFEECFPFYEPKPSEMKQEYMLNRNELTNDFIRRWWDSVLNQASDLKTVKGKQNKIDKCKEQLLLYKNELSEENLNLIENLTSMVIDLENLSKKEKETKPFDIIGETQVLEQLKFSKNVSERHFALIQAQDFYYKFRDTDKKYLDKCVELCLEDINLLDKFNREYIKEQKKMIKISQSVIGISQEDIRELNKLEKYGFTGIIPAWKRLCIIYEKECKFDKALEFCTKAIEYYSNHGMKIEADDFNKRKEKLEVKQKKYIKEN